MSFKRHKMSKGNSKRSFSHNAVKVHPKNTLRAGPMRGGIRL